LVRDTRIHVRVADCRLHIHAGIVVLFSNKADSQFASHDTFADETVVALLREYQADISLMDLRMTEDSAVETIKTLLTECSEGRTLVLAVLSPYGGIVPALREGARDCVLNDVPDEQMAEWIHAVNAGKRPRYCQSLSAKFR
jgi:DNA-binding NarL/FixJ family response regulator